MSRNPWLAPADKGATGQSFTIRTVEDFFAVPEARRCICLREFHTWLGIHENMAALLYAVADSMGQTIKVVGDRDVFVWHDDGKATAVVNMTEPQVGTSEPPTSDVGIERSQTTDTPKVDGETTP